MIDNVTLSNAAKLQNLNTTTLDTMSGQIYGSSQALTFEQNETVNRNLSNRLSDLAKTLENDSKFGFWATNINSKGKISKQGFAKGKTSVNGGQIGFDVKVNKNAILGVSFDYSKGKVNFDRYNGESKADIIGISLYGRQNIGNGYVAAKFGANYSDTNVKRDIIVNSNTIEQSNIKHKDKGVSVYLESGYDIKNSQNNLKITPYVALGTDRVTRGKFREDNTIFGLTADKKTYNMPYVTTGLRTTKQFDKIGLMGYVEYTKGIKTSDLNFTAKYNFGNSKFDVKGINYTKDKINAGFGVNVEVKKGFSLYSNYDYKHTINKSKSKNHIGTLGFRIEF